MIDGASSLTTAWTDLDRVAVALVAGSAGFVLPKGGARSLPWPAIAKVCISAALIGLLVLKVDIKALIELLRHVSPWPFAAAILVFALQCGFAGLRCRTIVGPTWPASVADHLRFFWIGQFFNQLLPSTVGGDAIRAWLLAGRGPPLSAAIKLTLVDRLAGVIGLMLVMVMVANLPLAPSLAGGETTRALGAVALVCLLGLAAVLAVVWLVPGLAAFKRYRLAKPAIALAEELVRLIRHPRAGVPVLILALAVHACSIGAFWLSAQAIGEPLRLLDAALVVPPMLLIAMVPVSVAGWGVREGVALFGLGILGVPAEIALSIAILFGLALLIASLPGGLLWHRKGGDTSPKLG